MENIESIDKDTTAITDKKEAKDLFYLKDPFLFEFYKKCLPPKEAYYYFPKGEDVMIYNKKKVEKNVRKIFNNVKYEDYEYEWIKEYKKIIESHPENKLPDYWSDSLNLKFIYASECKLVKAYERMIKYIKWYNETFPMEISPNDKLYECLNRGFGYVYGRDHCYRPIMVANLSVFEKCGNLYSNEEIINSVIFLSQFTTNYMLIPGQIENWDLIINIKGASIVKPPDCVRGLVTVLAEMYPSKMNKIYIIGLNLFLRIMYKIFCMFLEEVTVKKILVIDDEKTDRRMFEDIRPDNVEQKFGGTAPNVPLTELHGNFPPRMPSDKFLLDKDNPNEVLIKEEEYIKKYKEGNIPKESLSPYIKALLEKNKKIRKEKSNKLLNYKNISKVVLSHNDWSFKNEFSNMEKQNINKNRVNFLKDIKRINKNKEEFNKSFSLNK